MSGVQRWIFSSANFVVEVARTPCVVTQPWGAVHAGRAFAPSRPHHSPFQTAIRGLLNPANPSLAGASRPYFPRGGPLPPPPPHGLEHSSSGWGGLDAGSGMLYPAQVVDGLVHASAGPKLKAALAKAPEDDAGVRCKVGAAFATPAFALANFDVVSHSPTPFWPSDGDKELDPFLAWAEQLASCYTNGAAAVVAAAQQAAVVGAADAQRPIAIAAPLLGAGAAGAPFRVAVAVAVQAVQLLAQQQAQLGAAELARGMDGGGVGAVVERRTPPAPPPPLLLRLVLPLEDECVSTAEAMRAKLGAPTETESESGGSRSVPARD